MENIEKINPQTIPCYAYEKNDEIYSISLIRKCIFKIHIFQFKLFNFHITIYVWREVNDFEFDLFSYDRKKYVRYRCQASLFLHKKQHATSYSDWINLNIFVVNWNEFTAAKSLLSF